jgi:hypothetical protein
MNTMRTIILFAGLAVIPVTGAAQEVGSLPYIPQVDHIGLPDGLLIGQECDPDAEIPLTGAGGGRTDAWPRFECRPTGEWRFEQSRILNAKKGDILLSSSCDIIGQMLGPLGQSFTHSGILMDNGTRLKHSTATIARYRAYAHEDGISPDILKYGWPGTLTETFFQAYEQGAYRLAEDEGKLYRIQAFSDNGGCDRAPIYPRIVKPTPREDGSDDPEWRARVEAVADAAEQIDGHYRFYAYSEAKLVGNPDFQAPPGLFQFDGPEPTVCSQLIWSAALAAEVAVEDGNWQPGEQPIPVGTSGLYEYREDLRREAAQLLYDAVYDIAPDLVVEDVPDDVANQVVNCFAFDWCGPEPGVTFEGESHPKDSDKWRDPGAAHLVSPDDILWGWDAPPVGAYGHNVEMAWAPARFYRVHRWVPVSGTGEVVAIVRHGEPVEGATVHMPGIPSQQTDGAGQVRFLAVPAGQHVIDATATVVEQWASLQPPPGPESPWGSLPKPQFHDVAVEKTVAGEVIVEGGRVEVVVLDLASGTASQEDDPLPPPSSEWLQRVSVSGQIYIKDSPDIFEDVVEEWVDVSASVVLNPVRHDVRRN